GRAVQRHFLLPPTPWDGRKTPCERAEHAEERPGTPLRALLCPGGTRVLSGRIEAGPGARIPDRWHRGPSGGVRYVRSSGWHRRTARRGHGSRRGSPGTGHLLQDGTAAPPRRRGGMAGPRAAGTAAPRHTRTTRSGLRGPAARAPEVRAHRGTRRSAGAELAARRHADG